MRILSVKHLQALFSVVFICQALTARAQNSISGTVRDDKGETLPGVTVFLSGTKAITATDNNGKFSLQNLAPGAYTLTARFVGFQPYTSTITIIKDLKVDIKLRPRVSQIAEVKITAFSEEYYQKFRQYFLGTTPNAEKCTILNKEALHFHFDKANNTLTVTADDFLEIENKALGYKIKYLLQSFRLNEEEKTLAYQGQSVFEDLKAKTPKEAKNWKENQAIAYQGSIYHFLRSLYRSTLQRDGYAVYSILNKTVPGSTDDGAQMRPERKPLNADSLMKVREDGFKYFSHKQSLFLVYTNYEPAGYADTDNEYNVKMTTKWKTFPKGQYSMLSFLVPEIMVDEHGYYSPPDGLAVEGRMAWERIADLNPLEYGN